MKLCSGILSLLIVISAASTQAACGGGGYSVSRESKPAVVRQQPRQERQEVRMQSKSQSQSVSYRAPDFDMRRFDALSHRLELSGRQQEQVFNARQKVQERHDQLNREVARAMAKYESCQGRCDNEWRKLQDANAKLKAFDANAQFERRLSEILDERQFSTYRSASDTSAR
ncbi:MAG TPA: hypothetical protein VEK08_08155 [Planctomycetota bacterium]|nr:hypothetical protein [Planctomycetota bacterium]